MSRLARTTVLLFTALAVMIPSVSAAQIPPRRPISGAGGWVDLMMTMFWGEYSLCMARQEACYDSCAGQAADAFHSGTLNFDDAMKFAASCQSFCPSCSAEEIAEQIAATLNGGGGGS